MIKRFQKYILQNNLLNKDDEVLLAISGGIDSIVMLDLFFKNRMKFAISHCNFKLRMFESDDDELFVRKLAHKYNVDVFVNWCNTEEYAKSNKLSIQQAARDLRYSWFNQVCSHNNYSKIAVAHHQDDRIETFFINLFRGAGIKGLKSIPVMRQNIIRPLMFATRSEIEEYAKEHMLDYREDSSNNKDYYLRNNIRHNLIPLMDGMSKGTINSIRKSIDNLNDSDGLINSVVSEKIERLFIREANGTKKIQISELKKLVPFKIWMYFLFSKFGFVRQVTDALSNSLIEGTSTGQRYTSTDFELLIDRENLILREVAKQATSKTYNILAKDPYITSPIKINFDRYINNEEFIFSDKKSIAFFDSDTLSFPLTLRKWQIGDRIIPFGMKGSKLISDILIDNKVNSFEKENVYVILSNDKIIWLVGHRSSDEFKVTDSTKNILTMELISNNNGFDLELFK